MWDWTHFKGEGWLAHTKRSSRLAALLLLSGAAMILHILVPFWQQPEWLRIACVSEALCSAMKKKE
jgi:hypothetical protein